MKLLLIMVAVFGLVVCQVQALRGNFYESRDMGYRSPQHIFGTPNFQNDQRFVVVDKIVDKIKEFGQGVMTALKGLKIPIDQFGYTNLSKLIDDFIQALSAFVNKVGSKARIEESSTTSRFLRFNGPCQPFDTRPTCQRDYVDY